MFHFHAQHQFKFLTGMFRENVGCSRLKPRVSGTIIGDFWPRFLTAIISPGGCIINIGSTNAERMPFAGDGVYAISESALQDLVQGLARDLGPRGITINNVQRGPVNTEINPEEGE
jgi:NAD(P)-dependent dehydrogenase (short-subunit alcohol dehydrogenase family)